MTLRFCAVARYGSYQQKEKAMYIVEIKSAKTQSEDQWRTEYEAVIDFAETLAHEMACTDTPYSDGFTLVVRKDKAVILQYTFNRKRSKR